MAAAFGDASMAGIDVAVVTYRTTPELVTGLIRGDAQVGFEYYAGLNAAISGGQLKAVATTGSKHTPARRRPDRRGKRLAGLRGRKLERAFRPRRYAGRDR